jgi:hypothetical protein
VFKKEKLAVGCQGILVVVQIKNKVQFFPNACK